MLKVYLTQGHRLVAADSDADAAHLFAQVRTLRISQFSGFNCSTGLNDLAAARGAILPDRTLIFITFRELKPPTSCPDERRCLPRRH